MPLTTLLKGHLPLRTQQVVPGSHQALAATAATPQELMDRVQELVLALLLHLIPCWEQQQLGGLVLVATRPAMPPHHQLLIKAAPAPAPQLHQLPAPQQGVLQPLLVPAQVQTPLTAMQAVGVVLHPLLHPPPPVPALAAVVVVLEVVVVVVPTVVMASVAPPVALEVV